MGLFKQNEPKFLQVQKATNNLKCGKKLSNAETMAQFFKKV